MESFVYQDFDRLEDSHWWFAGRRDVVAAFLDKELGAVAGMKILDVGCGTGGMLPMLSKWGKVSGLDGSEAAVAAARKRAPEGSKLWVGDVPAGIPATHGFDLVTLFDVLEHLDDPVETIKRVAQALTPKGALLVTVPAYPFLWSRHDDVTHHRRRYTMETLRQHLNQGGMRIEASTHFNSILFAPVAAVRLLQKVIPVSRETSDMAETPKLANFLLRRLFSAERHVVSRAAMPFGVSIMVLARPAKVRTRGTDART